MFGAVPVRAAGAIPEPKVNFDVGIEVVEPELLDCTRRSGMEILNRVSEVLL